jgi:hypothetical protein
MIRRLVLMALGLTAALAVPGANAVDDPTAPLVNYTIVGTKGANGWYTSNVTVSWSFSDPETGIKSWGAGCNPTTLVNDTPGTPLGCSATNHVDVSTSVGLTIRIDKTAPVVSQATPDRPPDSGAWYTKPMRVSFTGADPTSGVENCSVVTYGGPDASPASVTGTCRDRAGNVSAAAVHGFHYDATAPRLSGIEVTAGSHLATLRWSPLGAYEVVTIQRSPGGDVVYRGGGTTFSDRSVLNGVRYRYVVSASDSAGNTATQTVEALPKGPLRAPAEKARVAAPPLLTWVKVRKADFYNVQLFRKGRKILSKWPIKPRLRLQRSWVWNGRRRTLEPGTYRWFVWPAFKRRGGPVRYGKPLGHSDFVITKR